MIFPPLRLLLLPLRRHRLGAEGEDLDLPKGNPERGLFRDTLRGDLGDPPGRLSLRS
jgi:hypothetical protein